MSLLLLSFVCALISTTVSESYVFKGLRAWVTDRNFHLGVGVSCAYCLSHWVAATLVLVHFGFSSFVYFLDLTFTVAWLAILQWGILKALLRYAHIQLSN